MQVHQLSCAWQPSCVRCGQVACTLDLSVNKIQMHLLLRTFSLQPGPVQAFAAVVLHWMPDWYGLFPDPPAHMLLPLERLLARLDPTLHRTLSCGEPCLHLSPSE